MAKKLQLAVAGLTDVGRRRERNQDNLTHYVPDADEVLEEKGALFVVCDGMGGHAAGEVASELGVGSLREVYYEGHDSDIISGIANAIRSANEAIFSFAREHVEMTGMGTTCVALIVQGGRAFFVNIGDSRAYIIRDGVMRQVTLDHSWVAEQVRAGVLTEEQARTHAHRNVITRSLGTQPTVSADLFIETLRDGDRVLLCSDGLHGYVEEPQIERAVVEHSDPEAAARQLIDMANANGGPDNITALIVHLLEVPEATGDVTLPLDPSEQPQIITQPLPTVGGTYPLAPVAEAARKRGQRRRKRGSRVAATALRLLAVAAILLIVAGIWDVRFGPYARARAATAQLQADITALRQAAQQASGQQDPAQALAALAVAQQRVQTDLRNPDVDPQVAQNARAALSTQLVPAVQNAVQTYNRTALVTTLADTTATRYDVTCAASKQAATTTLTNVSALAALPITKDGAQSVQPFYAVSAGVLYQVAVPLDSTGHAQAGQTTCAPVALPATTTIDALSVDGTAVYALTGESGVFQVLTLLPGTSDAVGAPTAKVQQLLTVVTAHGETPTLLAVQGMSLYVGYRAGTQGAAGLWIFTGSPPPANTATPAATPAPDATPAPTMVFDAAKAPVQVDLASTPLSLVAANNTAYTLLSDGSVGQLTGAQKYQGLPVQVLKPVAPEASSSYSAATPVPTVAGSPAAGISPQATATPSGNTLFSATASLALDPAHRSHVLVSDGANDRVVRFSGSPSGAGLGLVAQYAYGSQTAGFTRIAFGSSGTTLYGWSGAQLVAYALPTGGN